MVKFFLDTFALMEIISGNPKYEKYLGSEIFTSLMNLYEMYYNLLRSAGEGHAKNAFLQFKQFAVPIKDDHVFAASKFKLSKKSLNISYVDALGYSIALEDGMKFLTGDLAFKGADNVEFVK